MKHGTEPQLIPLACDVLILCAGFGTRLRPLTDVTPKPLIEVGGQTLLERHLAHLKREGATRVILNLHHHGEKIREFAEDGSRWGLAIVYSEEPAILDTGGAIKNIESLLLHGELLTINGDIALDPAFSYASLLAAHRGSARRALATMLLRKDLQQQSYGEIERDASGQVVGFLGSRGKSQTRGEPYMFTGIQVLSRELLGLMPEKGTAFSITRDVLQKLVGQGEYLNSVVFDGQWFDIGTPERLERARKEIGES